MNPHVYGQLILIFDEGTENIQWEKEIFSINGTGKMGYSHAEK